MENSKEKIKEIIESAKEENLLYESEVITGLSSKALTSLLQHLSVQLKEDECYLEVGVFQGLSLLSVSKAIESNRIQAYGIDNFSQFDTENKNFNIVKSRAEKLSIKNYNIINLDFEDALLNLKEHIGEKKVGVYFVDGPHDYRSQLLCLEYAKDYLSENAVIVVDDCNYAHVRQATYDFLRLNKGYRLVYQAYSETHPHQKNAKTDKWWNGINVICRNSEYDEILPEVRKDIMFAEHDMMTQKYPFELYEAGLFASALRPFRPIKLVRRFFKLWSKINRAKGFGGQDYLNTFSEEIDKEVNSTT
jgi:predicted O-methyltransferase YrrM